MTRLPLTGLLRAAVALLFLGVVLAPVAASAAECHLETRNGKTVTVCTDSGGEQSDSPVYTVPGPWTDYYYTPACSANGPPPGGADALCQGALSNCTDPGDIRMFVYTRKMTADNEPDGNWESQGSQCRGADDPPEGGPPVITAFMIRDAAENAAPESVVNSEPGVTSYVNVPTNFFTDDEPVTVTVQVLGIPIALTFEPQSVSWAFGDGGSGSGAGIEAAAVGAPGAVEHEYARQGDYSITVSRSFSVSAVLPGGQTLALDTPVSSTSEPYQLGVGEIQSVVTRVR